VRDSFNFSQYLPKNKLKLDADTYFDWSSINENKAEQKYELKISEMMDKIANDIEKIIYENKS
jgi:hypothetical protein